LESELYERVPFGLVAEQQTEKMIQVRLNPKHTMSWWNRHKSPPKVSFWINSDCFDLSRMEVFMLFLAQNLNNKQI